MRLWLGMVLLAGIVLAGCATETKADDSLNRIRQEGILRIATDPSYPPFAFIDGGGEPAGYDVELGRELASRLGVRAAFVGIEVTSAFDALIARRADVAIAAISPAWEWAKEIGFSHTYFNAGQVFIVRAGSKKITGPQELESARLGSEIGSAAELEARKLAKSKPGISLMPFDSLEAGAIALSAGKYDAVVADRVTAAMLVQGNRGLEVAGPPFTDEPYVIATRGSSRSLLKEIDALLGAMDRDGFLGSLERRFLTP